MSRVKSLSQRGCEFYRNSGSLGLLNYYLIGAAVIENNFQIESS